MLAFYCCHGIFIIKSYKTLYIHLLKYINNIWVIINLCLSFVYIKKFSIKKNNKSAGHIYTTLFLTLSGNKSFR